MFAAFHGRFSMAGVIGSREVLGNMGTIYREFGGRFLLRALWAIVTRRHCTFLELVMRG